MTENVTIGKRVKIYSGVNISASGEQKILIGDNSIIHTGAILSCYDKGSITIGKNVSVNAYAILYGESNLKIGNNVLIAAHCVIVPANHTFNLIDVPINSQPISRKGITIEDNVWLGTHVVVLDGVRIGKGSVVAAGSVVTKNIPEYSVVAGVPAKIIKMRN